MQLHNIPQKFARNVRIFIYFVISSYLRQNGDFKGKVDRFSLTAVHPDHNQFVISVQ